MKFENQKDIQLNAKIKNKIKLSNHKNIFDLRVFLFHPWERCRLVYYSWWPSSRLWLLVLLNFFFKRLCVAIWCSFFFSSASLCLCVTRNQQWTAYAREQRWSPIWIISAALVQNSKISLMLYICTISYGKSNIVSIFNKAVFLTIKIKCIQKS